MKNNKKKIVLAVSGGIAVYKAIEIASLLSKKNFEIFVLMTQSAQKFVTPLTFEAITKNSVGISIFPNKNNALFNDLFPHLYPAAEADLFIVVPATANIIAKIATGLADDIVSCSAITLKPECKKLICPAMNVNMWNQPIVQENIKQLKQHTWKIIGPDKGLQACGDTGYGTLAKPEFIVKSIINSLEKKKNKKILILSGPTYEPLDPVRYIGNFSSGKMGKEIAELVSQVFSETTFLTGPVPEQNLPQSSNIKTIKITSAIEMLNKAKKIYQDHDIILFVAAVADYKPKTVFNSKIISKQKKFVIELENNPDIAKTLSKMKKENQITIGFALETNDGDVKAKNKLKNKKFDAIILNNEKSLNSNNGTFKLITKNNIKNWGKITKKECAHLIVNYLNKITNSK